MKIYLKNKLYRWQQEVYDEIGDDFNSGETIVIKSPRQKAGKSTLISLLLIKCALVKKGSTSILITPTLGQGRKTFKDIKKMLNGSGVIEFANASLLSIDFINGSTIWFKSAEQSDSIRGLTATGILAFDETAFQSEEFIYTALPLAEVHKALKIFISTPMLAEGFFWKAFNNPNNRVFDWSEYINEMYSEEDLEKYKYEYSPLKYKTEILAEFIVEDGLFFRNIQDCLLLDKPSYNRLYIGIDFSAAVGGDYTAITVVNENGQMIDLQYTNKLTPTERVTWISKIINGYKGVQKILAEVNSIGQVYVDLLEKELKYPLVKWVTSNKSKNDIIQNLSCLFDNRSLQIISDKELLKELAAFECTINPKTQVVTYNGKNANDDLVMSTALAYYALKSSFGTYNISFK